MASLNKQLYKILTQCGGMLESSDVSKYFKKNTAYDKCFVRPNEQLLCLNFDGRDLYATVATQLLSFPLTDEVIDFLYYLQMNYNPEDDETHVLTDQTQIDEYNSKWDDIAIRYSSMATHTKLVYSDILLGEITNSYVKYKDKIIVYLLVGIGGERIDMLFPDFIIDGIKKDAKNHHLFIDFEIGSDAGGQKQGCPYNDVHITEMWHTKHYNKHYHEVMDVILKDESSKFDVVSIYGFGFFLEKLDSAMEILNSTLNPKCVLFHWGVSGRGVYGMDEIALISPLFTKYRNLKVYTQYGFYNNEKDMYEAKSNHMSLLRREKIVPKNPEIYMMDGTNASIPPIMHYDNLNTIHPCL